jgi:hypothetical protein
MQLSAVVLHSPAFMMHTAAQQMLSLLLYLSVAAVRKIDAFLNVSIVCARFGESCKINQLSPYDYSE